MWTGRGHQKVCKVSQFAWAVDGTVGIWQKCVKVLMKRVISFYLWQNIMACLPENVRIYYCCAFKKIYLHRYCLLNIHFDPFRGNIIH